MTEISINPKEFQSQIDSFKTGADSIKDIKYKLGKQGIKLQSIDKYLECIDELNKTIGMFGNLMDKDVHNMKLIKAKWMNADNELATKTAGEIVSDAISSKKK